MPKDDFPWGDVLAQLFRRQDLPTDVAAAAMDRIMAGAATPAQVAGFLAALRTKGETVEEIVGLVDSMRRHGRTVQAAGPLVDTCGTGGDRAGTFNVSTLAAVTAAAAGARVAKHGNRAASGRCGSADLLEHWGIVLQLEPDQVAECIDEVGIGFCFAPAFHPAMRHAVGPRRELAAPTVFNFLGPLVNPARAQHQTVGVSDPAMAPRLAEVLARTGAVHALVFHGEDGLDELTITGPSRVWEVRAGEVRESVFSPAEVGVRPAPRSELLGGGVEENARLAEAVLAGERGPRQDIVVLGAAAALYAGDLVDSWREGLDRAVQALESGTGQRLVERWAAVTRRLAPQPVA